MKKERERRRPSREKESLTGGRFLDREYKFLRRFEGFAK
jgi:hypothetical protein